MTITPAETPTDPDSAPEPPLATPAKRPYRQKVAPTPVVRRPDRTLLYYTAAALTQCSTLTEALTEAYTIMRRTGKPIAVEAVYEDWDAVAPRLRRERKAMVTP